MDTAKTHVNNELKFPKTIFTILLIQFVSKFSQHSFRGALPLYFVERLQFDESEATVTFHVLQVMLYLCALLAGVIADSFLGKYKVILYSVSLIALGFTTLTAAMVPPLHMPVTELTFFALCVIHIGFGGLMPGNSFGGDQFRIPQQAKQLSLFFVLTIFTANLGSILASFISPVIRKDVNCFGEVGCYSLVFGIPACLVVVVLVMLVIARKYYTIRIPEDNVIAKIVQCTCHALSKKVKSKEKNEHWLDYASDKYEAQFIGDIKGAFQVFKLYLPMVVFTALYAAEATTMTFQASRMNGEMAGYLIKPDQIHIVQPVFAVIALPIFHCYVFPFLAKFFHVDTHLKKVTIGLSLAALSYYAASIVELNLEATYAPKPTENNAHLRIYNAFDCNAIMTIDEQRITIDKFGMWENLNVAVTGKKVFKYSADFKNCSGQQFLFREISGSFEVLEKQANSFVLTKDGLSYKFIDHNNKSLSGNPLVRALIYMSTDATENNITLKIVMDEKVFNEMSIDKNIRYTKSEFFELAHGMYALYLDDQPIQSEVFLKLGGVYTILGYISNSSKVARVVTVTPPNSMHILWVLPQLVLFCAGLIIIETLAIEFLYSESATSMKALVQSYWVLLSAIGHAIVIIITEANFFDRKVFLFLLYAVTMTIGTIIFALLARLYKYRPKAKD